MGPLSPSLQPTAATLRGITCTKPLFIKIQTLLDSILVYIDCTKSEIRDDRFVISSLQRHRASCQSWVS